MTSGASWEGRGEGLGLRSGWWVETATTVGTEGGEGECAGSGSESEEAAGRSTRGEGEREDSWLEPGEDESEGEEGGVR